MRFSATFSVLAAALAVAPLALAMPVDFDSATGVEARELDVEAALFARTDPPHYHRHDPINGKKPPYKEKDPYPPPKYRQKDPNKPDRPKHERNGGPSRPRDLDSLFARTDPPHYHKHDPINGKKPPYKEKDPYPPPKYRQKDPNTPNRPKHERNGGPSRPRDLETVDELFAREVADEELWARALVDEDLWAREVEVDSLVARTDPPHYHKHDPINGKKPPYKEKDPYPPPKYRQKDPNTPNRPKHERNGGPSRPRDLEFVDYLW